MLQDRDLRICVNNHLSQSELEEACYRSKGRKQQENSTEKSEKWHLGVNMEATWGPGQLQK